MPASEFGKPTGIGGRRAALVIGHPGHELRVYGWLELARPVVCVLTDGSGHTGQSRLMSTTKLLEKANAKAGDIYGRLKDAEVYAAMLKRDVGVFTDLAEELAAMFVRERIDYVAGDAVEGYNPSHDLCRAVINAAVGLAGKAGRQIENYEFLTVGRPDVCPDDLRAASIWLELDDESLERKLRAAKSYAELSGEVDRAIEEVGSDGLRVECLRSIPEVSEYHAKTTPFYESYGEKQVAARVYKEVIRYKEHVQPIFEALSRFAR